MSGHHPSLQTDVELVTPALAREWLEGAAANRNLSLRAVDRFADDMRAERWMTNGQPIIFNVEGQLIDGRHRLSAVLLAGVEVPMLVVRGVAQEAFATMDSGRSRTIADVLSIQGHKNTNVLAASARAVWNYCAGVNLRYQVPRAVLLQLVENHPRFGELVTQAANRAHKTSLIPLTQTAAVLALANESQRWNGEVAAFLDGAVSGEGLYKGDARLTLRQWLMRARQSTAPGAALHGRRDGVRGGGAVLDRVRSRGEADEHPFAGDDQQFDRDDRGIRAAAVARRARSHRRPRSGVRPAEGDSGRE
jgi:hypothetical protein